MYFRVALLLHGKPGSHDGLTRPLNGCFTRVWVANDTSATTGFCATGFELRLDERYQLSAILQELRDRLDKLVDTDERGVHNDKLHRLVEAFWCEMACVRSLHDYDAFVLSEFRRELAMAHVHCEDAPCPMLQQAIRKAARRGTNIDCNLVGWVKPESCQGALQLPTPPRYVALHSTEFEGRVFRYLGASLVHALVASEDLSGKDERCSLGPCRGQPLFNDDNICPLFHERAPRSRVNLPAEVADDGFGRFDIAVATSCFLTPGA